MRRLAQPSALSAAICPRWVPICRVHRHRQEHARQHDAEHLLLVDLLRQRLVRHLLRAPVRTGGAVGREQLVERVDHLPLAASVRAVGPQPQRHAVEGAVHVERGCQALAPHPEDAEARVVAAARMHRHDVLGRQHDASDDQPLALAVQDHVDAVAGPQAARAGEAVVDQHLVRQRRVDPTAGHQRQPVDAWQPVRRQRMDARDHRLEHVVAGKQHVVGERGLGIDHAGQLEQPRCDAVGYPTRGGEHVGEARRVVVAGLHRAQRLIGGERGAERRHAAGDHERDGDDLALGGPEVAR